MLNLIKSNEDMRFDSRMIDWNLKNGLITQSEYETHLNSLKDSAANMTHINLEDDQDYSEESEPETSESSSMINGGSQY